jgi:4,5-dihydroxyphthalate decarboxylase
MRPIVIACTEYDRTRAFVYHSMPIDGADYTCLSMNTAEIFYRMYRYAEFDACEMSLGTYATAVAQGDDRFIALPIFLSRVFRHGNVFVRDGGAVNRPEDLKGKRIGVSEYEATAPIWVRGFLKDDFGVNPWDVEWVVARREKVTDIPYDTRIQVTYKAPGDPDAVIELNDALMRGRIDAIATGSISRLNGRGSRRLFPNYLEVEQDYYRRTGIFPIMHTFVMKRSLYEDEPWLARSLFKAFYQAKKDVEKAMYSTNGLPYTMTWMVPMIEQNGEVMGKDPWPYGVRESAKTLDAFTRYLVEQGLTKERLDYERLFAPVQWTNASHDEVSW